MCINVSHIHVDIIVPSGPVATPCGLKYILSSSGFMNQCYHALDHFGSQSLGFFCAEIIMVVSHVYNMLYNMVTSISHWLLTEIIHAWLHGTFHIKMEVGH